MHPKDADGMSNSVDPDLPVRKLKIITGNVSDNFTNTPIPRIFYCIIKIGFRMASRLYYFKQDVCVILIRQYQKHRRYVYVDYII